MQIEYHKSFTKAFKKLNRKLQDKVISRIEQFQKDPFHPMLKNHALKGVLKGKRAFSVTGNVRIIFEEKNNHSYVFMLDVGTHPQVY
jgi:addiction module RelE/StbE family toxin